jgi:hypothetical protein
MAEVKFKIQGLEDAKRLVREIGSRLSNPTPAMDAIGNLLVSSIHRNFEEGGRPTP